MGEHGALRLPGRPGRVLDLAEVVEAAVGRAHPDRGLLERLPGSLLRAGPADHDHVLERRDLVPDRPDHFDPARIGDHGHGPRVVERVEELALPVDDVGGDRDGTDPPAGEVTDQVLGRGVQVDADPVPFPDAEPEQARADAVRLGPEGGVGSSIPRAGWTSATRASGTVRASRRTVTFGIGSAEDSVERAI